MLVMNQAIMPSTGMRATIESRAETMVHGDSEAFTAAPATPLRWSDLRRARGGGSLSPASSSLMARPRQRECDLLCCSRTPCAGEQHHGAISPCTRDDNREL